MDNVYGIQILMNHKEQLHEIKVKTGVDIHEFTHKLFEKPLIIDGKTLRITEQRKMKDVIRNPITKVLIFEAPFPLKDQYILQKLSQYGDLQTNKISHHQYKGTDGFNGVRSINFKKITKPKPTVLFIRGNRIKLRHENQDREPICGVCKTKGHFRTDCPQLPLIQEYIDRDRDSNDPDAPEIRTWAQARQYVKEREDQRKEEQRLRELEKLEKERKLAMAEKKQRRREMLMRRKRNNQGGEYIGPLDDSEENMSQQQSPDDGFQTVGETNKRRRKGLKKKKKREAKNERDREEDTPPTSPRSAPSSPYHPDIGKSNGKVIGTEESERSSTEYEDVEEDDRSLNETQTISSSYPEPGQKTTENQMMEPEESAYPILSQKSWGAIGDDAAKSWAELSKGYEGTT